MIDYQKGIVVGDQGVILLTDSSGKNDLVGFEIPDYGNFGEFAEYADDMMLDGFKATVKIVGFGILFGFFIGVILAMFKTAPTNLKGLVEGRPNGIVRTLGGGLTVIGLYLFWEGLSGFSELGLDGIEYIFTPVGDPRGFAMFGLGIASTLLGLLFLSNNGKFSKIEVGRVTLNPWKTRPLNSIATLYTDFFRNTPLIVQFMFIHFGLSLGMEIQDVYESAFGAIGTDGFDYWLLGESAFISAIFTLGLNSGAYQCETIRGAIAAIPSGQMEAGRSIGLTYMGTMKLVIMPQAIRICIPPIGNEMVNLVLNSSLAMVIGYAELSRQGRLIIAVTFQIFWAWGMVMISYFVVTWTLALLLRRLEEKTKIPGLGISGGA
ncbi:MAG: amino acid ABC transporter permease, partial [Candidatus Thalassarchaeaceae archaeon]|jgi:polar amino acid transport system permease protein|nr:amino acid ABC transporter permease [Candidatus Thalassarchaeaceae archaeon]